ncbi:sigma 54-interacting transcriptional regulator, partial [Arthrospira platensis SPKY1]|nr:sigma 54-interacting transcriptional regulator [Arthrospira platensis SPKY1]
PFSAAEILARVKAFFTALEQGTLATGIAAPNTTEAKPEQASKAGAQKSGKTGEERYELKFVGTHPKIEKLLGALPQIANNAAPVFIQGESGTGKEVFASLIHYNSDR